MLAMMEAGWTVALLAGSLGPPGTARHAETFFSGVASHPVDYGPAVGATTRAGTPSAPVPMHPSYEDRPGAPDQLRLDGARAGGAQRAGLDGHPARACRRRSCTCIT